jgi:hypothetical protein
VADVLGSRGREVGTAHEPREDMRTSFIAAAFASLISIGAVGCLDNDQDTDNTQVKQDPDQDDPGNTQGAGDPGGDNSTNPALHDDEGMVGNQLDPQTSPDQTCHQRIKGTGRCE